MTHEELCDDELLQYGGLEFPQINYDQYNGKPYSYFYSCGFGHVFGDSLLKIDVHTKELKVLSQSNTTKREPVVNWDQYYLIKAILNILLSLRRSSRLEVKQLRVKRM